MPVISGMRWSAITSATGLGGIRQRVQLRQSGGGPVGGDDARVVPETATEVGLEGSQHRLIG